MSSEIAPSTPLSAESIAKSNHETGGVIESSGGAGAGAAAGALILDDVAVAEDPKQGRGHWRQWLRLSNLLQAVPGVALLTQSMLDAGQTLVVIRPHVDAPAAVSADWNQILDDAEFLERLQLGFVYLGNAGVPAPDEIGVELEDDGEYRAAEALWEKARIVFLGSAQSECAPSWKSAGFSVIEEGERWWLEVESALKGQMS